MYRYYAYLLRCADGSLYSGYTTDLEKREQAHNRGNGAKYTRARRPVSMVYYETFPTKSEAMRRETAFKRMTRSQKEELIARFRGTGKAD